MTSLKGNLMFGQSGGPTAVINSSAAGVFEEALKHPDVIGKVYGAAHGIVGVMNEDFYDIGQEDANELKLMQGTPSSLLGSVRYKLSDPDKDDSDYKKLLDIFRKYDIRYFLYNGGNDSMDTCDKVSKYLDKVGYDCRVVGVPKTIDNDLVGTDHCPGFGSAAKFVSTMTMEVFLDSRVYYDGMIVVIEIMGRHAGWLTASAALASCKGYGPDLIYLPESDFDPERMMDDVSTTLQKNKNVMIAVSEGVKTKDGLFIPELVGEVKTDAFGHKQLGGTAMVLSEYLAREFGIKTRAIELSLLQRCAAHLASGVDVEEAYQAGAESVKAAMAGASDVMLGFRRKDGPYAIDMVTVALEEVKNFEKKVPREWINEAGNGLKQEYIDYAMPLIQGASKQAVEDGLPRFARLKKVQAGRK
ncbi:MAG TPA: 6-phosphofructokinase [Clostridiaceae bacterium]|nr:6-phosphofructokinase [Clostridiaceae bacterium]